MRLYVRTFCSHMLGKFSHNKRFFLRERILKVFLGNFYTCLPHFAAFTIFIQFGSGYLMSHSNDLQQRDVPLKRTGDRLEGLNDRLLNAPF